MFEQESALELEQRFVFAHTQQRHNEVEVLFKNPALPYEVIADLQARNAGAASMRRQAAKIGADAVIVSFLGGYYSTHTEWADEKRMMNDTYSRVTGTAIKYK